MPTVREADGLALSSRNVYLHGDERAAAPSLHRALDAIVQAVRSGETDRERAIAHGRAQLAAPLREAYLDIVDPATFVAPDRFARRRSRSQAAGAARRASSTTNRSTMGA